VFSKENQFEKTSESWWRRFEVFGGLDGFLGWVLIELVLDPTESFKLPKLIRLNRLGLPDDFETLRTC
jgi:hypothetical protein